MATQSQNNTQLFSTDAGKRTLISFRDDLANTPEELFGIDKFSVVLTKTVDYFINHSELIDEKCDFNKSSIGDQFINAMQEYQRRNDSSKKSALQDIFTMAYRFLRELDLYNDDKTDLVIRQILSFTEGSMDKFENSHASQLVFATYMMPLRILKSAINHPSIGILKNVDTKLIEIKELESNWDENIKQKFERLEALSASAKNLTTKYNFVGLVKGFQDLQKEKEEEREYAFTWLKVISGAIIVVPIILLSCSLFFPSVLQNIKENYLFITPSAFTIELILFYFFRVVLGHFRSIKAQQLQLALRISLCQFIQSYVEYAKDGRSKAEASLDKFETIIFSGIISDETKIPSTFDGIDQLANLVKTFKQG